MSEARWSLIGLSGFVVSGVLFIIAGIRAGDPLAIAGSAVWIAACAVWSIPLVRRSRADDASSEPGPPAGLRSREAGGSDRRDCA